MVVNNKQVISILFLLGIIALSISSCGEEEPMMQANPCDDIELTGNTLDLNGDTYNISEYSYSDFIILNHNFRFTAFADNCLDSVKINLDFGQSISFPDFSLAGEYETKFEVNNVLEIDIGEMRGSYAKSGESSQYIVSGGSAKIEEPDDSSYLITIDSPTSSLTGGVTDVMQLSVVVAK